MLTLINIKEKTSNTPKSLIRHRLLPYIYVITVMLLHYCTLHMTTQIIIQNWSCQNDENFYTDVMTRIREKLRANFHSDRPTGLKQIQTNIWMVAVRSLPFDCYMVNTYPQLTTLITLNLYADQSGNHAKA